MRLTTVRAVKRAQEVDREGLVVLLVEIVHVQY
jgi:hypothetical protein